MKEGLTAAGNSRDRLDAMALSGQNSYLHWLLLCQDIGSLKSCHLRPGGQIYSGATAQFYTADDPLRAGGAAGSVAAETAGKSGVK